MKDEKQSIFPPTGFIDTEYQCDIFGFMEPIR